MGDYWFEAVDIALNDEGIKATRKQIDNIAGAIEISAENCGMAHGHHDTPSAADRAETEKDRTITALREEIADLEGAVHVYRSSVARRRNVDVDDVYLERIGKRAGSVMIRQ